MKFPHEIPIYGDKSYRNKNCRLEWMEQKEFFGFLKDRRPNMHRVAIHPKNEGKRNGKQSSQDAELGSLNTGASDVIIPVRIPFICEIKRADHTCSHIPKEQVDYLTAAQQEGAFVCIALGSTAAWEAYLAWEEYRKNN